jgi:hypothetical protein
VLCCTVVPCAVLYCTVLYCTVLPCTAPCCSERRCAALCRPTVLYGSARSQYFCWSSTGSGHYAIRNQCFDKTSCTVRPCTGQDRPPLPLLCLCKRERPAFQRHQPRTRPSPKWCITLYCDGLCRCRGSRNNEGSEATETRTVLYYTVLFIAAAVPCSTRSLYNERRTLELYCSTAGPGSGWPSLHPTDVVHHR